MNPTVRNLLSRNAAEKFVLVLLIGAVFPFFILATFCHPSVDDFWLTNMVIQKGIWPAFWEIRQEWSGRYVSMFLTTINPLTYRSLIGYKIQPVIILFLTISGANFFIKSLLPQVPGRQKWLLTLLLIVLFLGYMPVVAEVIYWMSGTLNYQTGCLALLYFLGLLLQQASAPKKSVFRYLVILLLAFFIVGSNETIMTFLFYFSVTLCGLNLLHQRRLDKRLIGLFLITAIGCCLVIFAPGNAVRSAQYPEQGKIIYAAGFAIAVTINNVLNWLTFTPTLLLTLLFIPFCYRQKRLYPFQKLLHPILYWLVYFGGLATCYFVSYYSKGDHAPPRVQDTIYFLFILGWFFNIFYTTQYIAAKGIMIPALPAYAKFLLGFACFLWFFLNKQSNIRTAYSDLLSGRAARYDKEMDERYAYLKNSPCKSCPIEPVKNIPKTIFFEEVDNDTTGWRNLYTAQYFGKRVLLVNKSQLVTADSAAVKH